MRVKSEKNFSSKKSRLKLSKNLLEMKFMKRSKEDQEKRDEQNEYEKMFESVQSHVESGVQINYQRDVGAIEQLVFPRRSYGGFDNQLERLMKDHDEAHAASVPTINPASKSTAATVNDEVDVSDEAMAEVMSTGANGAIRRKFASKRHRRAESSTELHSTLAKPSVVKRARQFLKPQLN